MDVDEKSPTTNSAHAKTPKCVKNGFVSAFATTAERASPARPEHDSWFINTNVIESATRRVEVATKNAKETKKAIGPCCGKQPRLASYADGRSHIKGFATPPVGGAVKVLLGKLQAAAV
uniref:Uncharacterized protein n=1 Tax=Plectus sambesii TaxID=2011161 RepID=A0A914VVF6_9BILA